MISPMLKLLKIKHKKINAAQEILIFGFYILCVCVLEKLCNVEEIGERV